MANAREWSIKNEQGKNAYFICVLFHVTAGRVAYPGGKVLHSRTTPPSAIKDSENPPQGTGSDPG